MKKTKLLSIAAISLLISLVSCSWQIPEKVSVKSQAKYEFGVGTVDKQFKDFFNMDDMFKEIPMKNAEYYDYFPGQQNPNVQSYILKLPIQEIPINIGEYYAQTDIAKGLEGMSFEQKIDIPKIDQKFTPDVDIAAKLEETISYGMTSGGASAGNVTFGAIESGTVTSVTYGPNSKYEITPIGSSNNIKLRIGDKTLNPNVENGKYIFDISGCTLSSDTKISFDGVGGYTGKVISGKISKAEGVIFDLPSIEIKVTVPPVTSAGFVSGTIGDGTFTYNIDLSKWATNTTCTKTLNGWGWTNQSVEKDLSIAGKTINNTDSNEVTSSVVVKFENSTIDFSQKPIIDLGVNINSFSLVEFLVDDSVTTSFTKEEALPEGATDFIKTIRLTNSGISGTYKNTLPADNNIEIKGASNFFGMTDKTTTFESNKHTDTPFTLMSDYSSSDGIKEIPITKGTKWDFTVNMTLPNYNPNKKTMKLKNIATGESYVIGMTVTPELNWKSIDLDNAKSKQTGGQKLGFSLKEIFKTMEETTHADFSSIEVGSVPIRVCCVKPSNAGNTLDKVKISGSMKILYGTETVDPATKESTYKADLVNGKPVELDLLKEKDLGFTTLPTMNIKDKVVINDVMAETAANQDILSGDMAGIINATKNGAEGHDIFMTYDIALTDGTENNVVTIESSGLENIKEDTVMSIAIYGYVALPLEFNVVGKPVSLNLLSMMGNEDKDLFNRTEPTDLGDIEQYMSAIKQVGVSYKSAKVPFYSEPPLHISMNLFGREKPTELSLKDGTLALKSTDVKTMLETYPFMPKLSIEMPIGKFSVPRNIEMKTSMSMLMETDGTIELFGGKK